jgi:hypothetical protein
LEAAQKFYVERWAKNAAAHTAAGDYDWMLDQLSVPASRVLDIGVGEGSGAEAILRRLQPTALVAVEENRLCAERAKARLTKAEHDVEILNRLEVHHRANLRDYSFTFQGGAIAAASRVAIVISDLLIDPTLADDLISSGPFDAVTAWLIGAHEARQYCEEIDKFQISSPAEYRLRMQNSVYELANVALRAGGQLQIVDRIQHRDLDAMRAEFIRSHTEQAEPTTLQVESVDFRKYNEGSGRRVTLIREMPDLLHGPLPSWLVSVVSKKR